MALDRNQQETPALCFCVLAYIKALERVVSKVCTSELSREAPAPNAWPHYTRPTPRQAPMPAQTDWAAPCIRQQHQAHRRAQRVADLAAHCHARVPLEVGDLEQRRRPQVVHPQERLARPAVDRDALDAALALRVCGQGRGPGRGRAGKRFGGFYQPGCNLPVVNTCSRVRLMLRLRCGAAGRARQRRRGTGRG